MDRWGVGAAEPLATAPGHAPGRRAVLRAARPNTRPSVGARWRPITATRSRGPRGCTAPLRTTPAPARSRGGDVARRGPTVVIQRQLGHADLAITSMYLRGIDNTEIVHAVHERPAPMIPATHGLGTPSMRPFRRVVIERPCRHGWSCSGRASSPSPAPATEMSPNRRLDEGHPDRVSNLPRRSQLERLASVFG